MNRLALLMAVVLCLTTTTARGETVFVSAAYREVGNGWLFGSRSDGSCWIVLPWHVVSDKTTGTGTPFAFRDQSGRNGESDVPIHVSSVPGALEAAGDVEDLAFARVTAGRTSGDCTSRLGLPAEAYVDALNKSADLGVTYMQEASIVTFGVERYRSLTDDARGSLFLVRPLKLDDRAFLQGGLSGATVLLDWESNALPAAMVLEVPKGEEHARVVRFDRIRAAFEVIETSRQKVAQTEPEAVSDGISFEISSLLATATPESAMLSSIPPGGCWQAAAPAGQRLIEFVLQIKAEVRVSELHLRADRSCGPATSLTIEVNKGMGWTTLNSGCPVNENPSLCRVGATGPLELRFRALVPQGVIGVSELSLR
ncbi:MAG: hypothetical protein U1E06_07285 [Tabrizicola sp.]|nr:hypothetical protein [Tabrizicola sp.]